MPKRVRDDDDSDLDDDDRPAARPKKSNTPLLIGLIGGGAAILLLCGGCVVLGLMKTKKTQTQPTQADLSGQNEPIPESFDFTDPKRSLHWLAKSKPPFEATGNAIQDKRIADWGKQRDVLISSRPVRWPVKILAVNEKGEASLQGVFWPLSVADADRWLGDKRSEWTFTLYELGWSRPPQREAAFPIRDKEWAKVVNRGADGILVGTIDKIESGGGGPIFYGREQKSLDVITVVIRNGEIEKP